MGVRRELHWGRVFDCYVDRAADAWSFIARTIAERPDAIAIVDGPARISFRQLERESAGVAAMLVGAGVGQGDRVAVMLDNGADIYRALLGVIRIGAIIVPVSTRSRSAELAYIFADCEPAAIIHGAQFENELPAEVASIALRCKTAGPIWSAAIAAELGDLPAVSIGEEDLFGILYTSGTTGKPKGAMLTHLNVVHSGLHWREAHSLSPDDRTLLCVPWAHVSGLCGVVMPFLFLGATQIVLGEFKRRRALELASEERITHALMVPAMYGLCLLEPDLVLFNLSSWRIAAYGGAPMPEPTIARFAEAFPHLAMCNCYGATETTSPTTIMPPGEGTAKSHSIGKVVRCGDVRVMDDQGCEVVRGADGELWIAGPMVIPGYWRNDVATASSFAGGYWKSGDIGSIDEAGYVRIADRKKDMIIRGGFKVYPAEVESVLSEVDGVIEAAVVGAPDSIMGEFVIAFVSASHKSVDELILRDRCASRLSDYKVPCRIEVSDLPLPRNVNGKIQKAELRERAALLAVTVGRR